MNPLDKLPKQNCSSDFSLSSVQSWRILAGMKPVTLLFILGCCQQSLTELQDSVPLDVWTSQRRSSPGHSLSNEFEKQGSPYTEQAAASTRRLGPTEPLVNQLAPDQLKRVTDNTAFHSTKHELFLELLCARQMTAAENLRFHTARFVADLDTNNDFSIRLQEGADLSHWELHLPAWLDKALGVYKQAPGAAFAMFSLLDTDRSGYISHHDFLHWMLDTDMDGCVSICEVIDHVNSVAALAEDYNFRLQNQSCILWNYLYGERLMAGPKGPHTNRPALLNATTINEVRANEILGSELSTAWDTLEKKMADKNKSTIESRCQSFKPAPTSSDQNVLPQRGGLGITNLAPEQDIAGINLQSDPEVSAQHQPAPQFSAEKYPESAESNLDDLTIQGFFRLEG